MDNKFLVGLVFGVLLVGGGVWFFSLSDDKITGNIIAGDLINQKVYKESFIANYNMIPSDPTGSLEDFFSRFLGEDL